MKDLFNSKINYFLIFIIIIFFILYYTNNNEKFITYSDIINNIDTPSPELINNVPTTPSPTISSLNIIILIIASDERKEYLEMQKIWKKYMNNHKNITCFFIKSLNSIQQDILLDYNNNIMYIKNNETFIPGILYKTIKAIEFCINHFEFTYIYRTNLSSLLDLSKMYNFLNRENINYGGSILNYNNGINFASGSGFVLSKDTSKYLVENNNLLDYNLSDDVSIGNLLSKKYKISDIKRHDIIGLDDHNFVYDNDIFHFRCKYNSNHSITLDIMNKLYKNIYDK
jgi:hypothetical protein